MSGAGATKPGFSLPVGTVTFLLTDIAGSTRSWETAHDAMATAVARYAGFDAAYAEGRALDDDAVVEYVTRARGERRRPAVGWDSLTPTEAEVVARSVLGLTNRQIADKLLMGAETVKTHLSRVYDKLGVRNRTQLAAAHADRRDH